MSTIHSLSPSAVLLNLSAGSPGGTKPSTHLAHLRFMANVTHTGGCHCRRVQWQVEAPANVVTWECNCSNCSMRGNTHFIVPSSKFKLIGKSESYLTTYTFGTHAAKHIFCKICGITSYYIPRSNPDGVAVTYKCVDPGTLTHVEIRHYDGRHWEESYQQSAIAEFSKSDGSS